MNGRTDRRTELRQQYRALHYMPHGKNRLDFDKVIVMSWVIHFLGHSVYYAYCQLM